MVKTDATHHSEVSSKTDQAEAVPAKTNSTATDTPGPPRRLMKFTTFRELLEEMDNEPPDPQELPDFYADDSEGFCVDDYEESFDD